MFPENFEGTNWMKSHSNVMCFWMKCGKLLRERNHTTWHILTIFNPSPLPRWPHVRSKEPSFYLVIYTCTYSNYKFCKLLLPLTSSYMRDFRGSEGLFIFKWKSSNSLIAQIKGKIRKLRVSTHSPTKTKKLTYLQIRTEPSVHEFDSHLATFFLPLRFVRKCTLSQPCRYKCILSVLLHM